MAKDVSAAVYGASGYLGAEVLRKLLGHPHVEVTRVFAADHIGKPISAAHLSLEGKSSLRFEEAPPGGPGPVDVVFLALPHEASWQVARDVLAHGTRVIDLSGAFRLRSAEDYVIRHGKVHPLPELLSEFVYGLPELNRERIRGTRFVANPGCFATAFELSLLPLARAGWLRGPVRAVGITGSSGSGATPGSGTHHPVRHANVRPYNAFTHPHAEEIVGTLSSAGARDLRLDFVPISGPYVRGIFATAFVDLPAGVGAEQVLGAYRSFCEDEPFCRVPEARLPEIVAVAGSNYVEISAVVDAAGRTVCFGALDNLIKGGAGQAVQNMNLMLGFDETLSLTDPGGFP